MGEVGTFYLKACYKCKGDLSDGVDYAEGYSVSYKICLQCGLMLDLRLKKVYNVGGLENVVLEEGPSK